MVIRGARQVGKTSLVRAFATAHTGRFAELNLEQPAHAALFRRGLSLNETIQSILLECRVPAAREPLLLFLDEIQAVPEAVALLRFFHEERPDIRVIAKAMTERQKLQVCNGHLGREGSSTMNKIISAAKFSHNTLLFYNLAHTLFCQ